MTAAALTRFDELLMAMSPEERKRKACENAQKWWLLNKERAAENKRQWRKRKRLGLQEPRKLVSPEERKRQACARAKKWHHTNKDKARETKRQWKALHPEEYKERKKQSYLRHRDEIRQRVKESDTPARQEAAQRRAREWYETHADLRQTEEWRKGARLRAAKHGATRRAAKVKAGGAFTAKDITRLYALQGGKCAGCGIQFQSSGSQRYHIDHIIPLKPRDGSAPGSNGPENLQLLCRRCNCQKGNLPPEEWKRRRKSA